MCSRVVACCGHVVDPMRVQTLISLERDFPRHVRGGETTTVWSCDGRWGQTPPQHQHATTEGALMLPQLWRAGYHRGGQRHKEPTAAATARFPSWSCWSSACVKSCESLVGCVSFLLLNFCLISCYFLCCPVCSLEIFTSQILPWLKDWSWFCFTVQPVVRG